MKSSLLTLWLLVALSACHSKPTKDLRYEKLVQVLGSADSLGQYQHFLIISTSQCAGCVADLLANFIKMSTPAQRAATLVVMDTLHNKAYTQAKQHLSIRDVRQASLEQAYPFFANIVVVSRQGHHIVNQHAYDESGDTSAILKYYAMQQP